jgi:hypothetical protein
MPGCDQIQVDRALALVRQPDPTLLFKPPCTTEVLLLVVPESQLNQTRRLHLGGAAATDCPDRPNSTPRGLAVSFRPWAERGGGSA